MSGAPRHFLDLSDFEGADLRIILNDAKAMKAGRAGLSKGTHETTALLAGERQSPIRRRFYRVLWMAS